jgi:AbrB family transcriptional regulator, stage V sporulation protein T
MLKGKVSGGGRVVIPAELREKHGIRIGDTVVWRDDGDGLRLTSRVAGLRRAQQIVARCKRPGDGSLVDELIQDRRNEAKRE